MSENSNKEPKFVFDPVDYNINDEMRKLLIDEPFLADVSVYIRKVMNPDIPSAMATYNRETNDFEIHLNPSFMAQFEFSQRKWIIIHELTHIFAGHLTFRPVKNIHPVLAIQGLDAAINSMPRLKEIMPQGEVWFANGTWFNLIYPGYGLLQNIPEEGKSAEFYLERLQKEMEQKDYGNDFLDGVPGGHDDHSAFGNGGNGDDNGDNPSSSDDAQKEVNDRIKQQEQLQNIIRKAYDELRNKSSGDPMTNDKNWGSISQEMRQHIISFITIQEFSPEEVLALFVGSLDKGESVKRWSKVYRRLPYLRPGRRHKPNKRIGFAIDQSGSVGNDLLARFNAFASKFKDYIDFYVVPFDHSVHKNKVIFWERGTEVELPRTLCGGTCFNAPTQWANDRGDLDGLIICTDGQAPVPRRCNVPRMWVTSEENKGTTRQVAGDELVMVV